MSNLILQAKFSSQQSTNNQWRVVCQVKSIFPNQLLYIWGLCYNVKMSSPTVLKCLITVNGEPNYLFNFQFIVITILNWQRWKFTDRIRSRGILQGQICRNSVITCVERFIIRAPEQVLVRISFLTDSGNVAECRLTGRRSLYGPTLSTSPWSSPGWTTVSAPPPDRLDRFLSYIFWLWNFN